MCRQDNNSKAPSWPIYRAGLALDRLIVGSNLHLLQHWTALGGTLPIIVLQNFLQRIWSISSLLLFHIMMYNCIDSHLGKCLQCLKWSQISSLILTTFIIYLFLYFCLNWYHTRAVCYTAGALHCRPETNITTIIHSCGQSWIKVESKQRNSINNALSQNYYWSYILKRQIKHLFGRG